MSRPVHESLRPLVGATATLEHRVRMQDSATAWGNELPVLATPVLLWLGEIASMKAIGDHVPAGWMTVGSRHESSHEGPTGVGATVTVQSTLVAAEGRALVFDVEASDGDRRILSGRHVRGLVHTATFRTRYGV